MARPLCCMTRQKFNWMDKRYPLTVQNSRGLIMKFKNRLSHFRGNIRSHLPARMKNNTGKILNTVLFISKQNCLPFFIVAILYLSSKTSNR